MSMKKRLQEKSGDLAQPTAGEATKATPKTAPGQMLAFRGQMIESGKRVSVLEERLKEFEGGKVTRLLNPEKVFPAKWANRSEWSFADAEFERLKEAIQVSGGNVQPIKVRPRRDSEDEFEIVFGRRRHRACLDLKIPVLALIDTEVTDLQLFSQMDAENRERKDLSPWEQGVMYRMALNEGLWKSQRQMADGLGVTQALISSAIGVADLPEKVIAAFPSPNEIQFRWAKLLQAAVSSNRDEVLKRAVKAAATEGRSARETLAMLLAEGPVNTKLSSSVTVVQTRSGVTVQCPGESLNDEMLLALRGVVTNFLEKQKQGGSND